MKKMIAASVLLTMLFTYSCQKQPARYPGGPASDADQALLQQAENYFAQQGYGYDLPADPGDSIPYAPTSLHKTPLWGQAQVLNLSFGKGIAVPVGIAEPLTIRIGAAQQSVSASALTWLFMYQDSARAWHAQVLTRIPFSLPAGQPFRGEVRVEDWNGHFLKAYAYTTDSTRRLTQSTIYRKRQGATGRPTAPTEAAASEVGEVCTETDWYACTGNPDGSLTDCEYEYTEEECTVIGTGEDEGNDNGGAGTPSASDYAQVGGGGSSTSTAPAACKILPDTSITHDSIVACVWNHLMSPLLRDGLQSILSGFANNTIYNISFSVVPDLTVGGTMVDGDTRYLGNDDFQILINGSEADDPAYSRIYLAGVFIHEAFHAKLRQMALATFGTDNVAAWPTPIDNMTLAQLLNYYEAAAKANQSWNYIGHEWMTANIDSLATSLQEFVQTFYPSTADSIGTAAGLAPYEALMYMGLQGTTLYQEQVVNTGLSASFQNYWQELNEGGKCSD